MTVFYRSAQFLIHFQFEIAKNVEHLVTKVSIVAAARQGFNFKFPPLAVRRPYINDAIAFGADG